MAGIGFALGSLYRSHTIADRAAAYAHAAIIVAGPCIVAVLCIWLIGVFMADTVDQVTISVFRALVIYCFAISFVVTAPIAYVSARLVSDKLHERDVTSIFAIMLAAIALTAIVVVAIAAPLFRFLFNLDDAVLVATAIDCTLIAFVWIGALFSGVTRDYGSITAFFAVGMLVALVAVTLLFPYWPSLAGMLWAFGVGVSIILFGLLGRILATFPFAVRNLRTPWQELFRGLVCYWPIALGGLTGAVAAWIDKWIVWLSPVGQHIAFGLVHAPLYDSVVFLSYLIAVPAYAAFFLRLEVRFVAHYRRYYSDILGHATLRQIEANGKKLRDVTLSSITGIMIPQTAICAVVALTAPLIIELLGMQFRQVGVLRLCVVGASFQFLFMTCSSLILYFDRRMVFLALQVAYLVLNAGFTLASLKLGVNYLGLGFLFASVIAAALAYLALARTLHRLDYLTFIANNPAVRTR
jgi:uncharacterized membrane protein